MNIFQANTEQLDELAGGHFVSLSVGIASDDFHHSLLMKGALLLAERVGQVIAVAILFVVEMTVSVTDGCGRCRS